jgi:hypothetical protein
MGWVVLAAAIAMLACMQGWNGATHRKEDGTARVMTIQSLPHGELGRLLDRKFRGHLLRALLGHVAIEADISQRKGEMEYESLRGSRIHLRTAGNELYVNERGRVVKDLRCGRHRVCVVDLVLDSGASAARTERLPRSCFT